MLSLACDSIACSILSLHFLLTFLHANREKRDGIIPKASRRHLEGISKDGRSMGKGTSHEGCLNCLNLTFALSLTSHTSGNYQQELLGVGKPNPVSGTNTADIRKFL